jgi:2-oxoglutarate dehydrogenase E2 component (dihydrolipoamide succinyltransferase)
MEYSMPVEIRVPSLGESIFEATVGRWLKAEGEAVKRGEALVELETDKVNLEVTADQDGVLQSVAHPAGDVVGIGDVLGQIGEAGTGGAAAPTPTVQAPGTPPAMVEAVKAPPSEAVAATEIGGDTAHTPASPLARRVAEEHGIDLGGIQGTGARGRVTREDVLDTIGKQREQPVPAAPAVPTPLPAPAQPAREERVRMTRRRLTIARRLVEAQQTAAMLTTFNEADLSAVMAVRARRRDAFKERHGVGLGFMSFFTKAVVGALKAFPRLNAEVQGEEMVLKHYYDIGIAVGAEEGLVVPVVRDADRKTFAAIEREIGDLAARARANTLTLADLQGGTFTITNGGVFGSLMSTPILNAPQVGTLGMHKIQERPVVRDGQIVVRPMMYLALSYDHRIVDGREAVQFLVRVKEMVEDPETLLLDG